ncbi:peptide chain release factor N(5)-glutamine methyltransferase [[Mycoplasma] collis]|uniref:peptide chain release factor N(5)-glutamine methyltransferase n=1 Tax=[Mycoplasma] collis TaxID=2127 RepID=UPI00051B4D81|nr:peptide chain release factor N(5)-glutamine methyltransferase [[Mycoplasma] collis]
MPDYKKRKDQLLHEKLRYNLELLITDYEDQLLKTDIPIQKIIGFVEMQNLKLFVDRYVLIPRYETEELILKSYEFIDSNSEVLDLCSGTGFIGLAIAKNKKCKVTLSDISYEAISQIIINKNYNKIDNIEIIQSDLFNNLGTKKFDIIVSNPPYLNKWEILDNSVLKHEPKNALFADLDGNLFYEKIIKFAPYFLKKNGVLLFEISPNNVSFLKSYKGINVSFFKDINKKERIALIKF